MNDPTEHERRRRLAEITAEAGDRAVLEARYGQVWDTAELARDYIVTGFAAPFVAVIRKADNARGTLEFQPQPRFYFNFQPD